MRRQWRFAQVVVVAVQLASVAVAQQVLTESGAISGVRERGTDVYKGVPFAELWYVFDHLDQSPWHWTAADRKVAAEISSYWVNFARTGNPNGAGLPTWPAFTNADGKVLYLGDPITVGGVVNIKSLSVFDAVYTSVRGAAFGTR